MAGIATIIIAAIVFIIYKKSRIEAIKLKFAEDKFKPKKKVWNIMFILYLVFTIVAFFALAFYKPGYLP